MRGAAPTVAHLLSRDPALLVAALGIWAILSGVALLWPGSAFGAGPSYSVLHALEGWLPEPLWGAAQVASGLALALSALGGGPVARPLAALASVAVWLPFGLLSVAGGLLWQPTPAYPWGIFSGVGAWWCAGSLFLIAAGVGWVEHAACPALAPDVPASLPPAEEDFTP